MTVKAVLSNSSPYDKYVESLRNANLLTTAMGRDWLEAGTAVFHDSVVVRPPFSESGFFQAGHPEARSYRFRVRDGQVLTVDADIQVEGKGELFADLFVLEEGEWEQLMWADSTLSMRHEFSDDGECILRLQPELLLNAWYSVTIALTPALANPVYGASNRSIGGLYGDPRDHGKRSHEGVDIFARRGTPVIAPTDGYISRVGRNRLGGKVVWMRDQERRYSYYFAHLDSQMVTEGMQVRRGHVLGLVGNTGNARNTAPHLHFGIYRHGPRNPLYYIREPSVEIASITPDTTFQPVPFKVRVREVPLRVGPSLKLPARLTLMKNTYLKVVGKSRGWYRVTLPDDREGFVLKSHVTPLEEGVLTHLDTTRVVLSEIRPDAVPVAILNPPAVVRVLARFEDYTFVMTEKGKAGWLFN